MEWPRFGKKKPIEHGMSFAKKLAGSQTKRQLVLDLGNTVINASLSAEGAILDAWKTMPELGGKPNDWKTSWVVRTEMIFFLLHLMDRFAFQAVGREIADMLVDIVTPSVLESVTVSSWEAPPTGEKRELRARMLKELIVDFNNAAEDYSSASQLVAESTAGGTVYNDKTLFGKLCGRIARELGFEHALEFRLIIFNVSSDILVNCKLKNHVEEVCQALK